MDPVDSKKIGEESVIVKESPEQKEQGAPDLSFSGDATANKPENGPAVAPPPAQLTIFYAGSVSVFDGVPPEKAQAIMLIASAAAAAAAAASASANNKNNSQQQLTASVPANATAASATLTRCLSLQSSSAAAGAAPLTQPQLLPNGNSSLCKLQAELPIARRHSLQRFLEKRRDRLVSKSPYPAAAKKTADPIAEAVAEAEPQFN